LTSISLPIIDVNGSLRPLVPVFITNPDTGKFIKSSALIDTGSDGSCFPEFIAKTTGHNLKGTKVKTGISHGIGGSKVKTWKHSFTIGLIDPKSNIAVKWTPRLIVDCFDHNKAPPILGSKDFLKDFIVSLDYPNKTITLSW